MNEPLQDVFISHASSDKIGYIYPLTEALSTHQVTFWLDDARIAWGDSVFGKINEGLRDSHFALLCLSENFLFRRWPEAEMSAVLSMQNTHGVKRALPLILNSKAEVLKHYPLIAGLAYREFDQGVDAIAAEIAHLTNSQNKPTDTISLTVEGVHTGKLCRLQVLRRASVKWLAEKARAGLEGSNTLRAGPFSEFHIRWALIDVAAEEKWLAMSRAEKREIYAMLADDGEVKIAYTEACRLEDLGVKDGSVFHLYAIEDERFDPPSMAA